MVLAIYSDKGYKEIHLPQIDDQDYEAVISAADFGIAQDIHLLADIMDGSWRVLATNSYRIFSNGNPVTEIVLEDGQIFQLETYAHERLAALVWGSKEKIFSYNKYEITSSHITIGRSKDNDICYEYQDLVSHYHAELALKGKQLYVNDKSRNGTYLDHRKVKGAVEIPFGGQINIFGLSIICLGNVLAINEKESDATVSMDHLNQWIPFGEATVMIKGSREAVEEKTVHVSPRNIPRLYLDKEVIDNVPQKREGDRRPAWMSVLPSLTMVLPMMLGYSLMGSNMQMGLVISGGSAVVGVMWAIINLRYTKKELKEAETKRLKRYEEYLVECSDRIREKYEFNRNAMLQMYPDAMTCSLYSDDSREIWARRPSQFDFLFVRLGIGTVPFQVEIQAPKPGFTLENDELALRPSKIADNYANLNDVPVGVELKKEPVVGILADSGIEMARSIARLLLTQITANHCYTDVKIAYLYDEDSEREDDRRYIRWFPHIWNEERSFRYIALDEKQANEVLYHLAQILRKRTEDLGENSNKKEFLPHYILFVENPKILEGQMIAKYLYEEGEQLGITTILMADKYEDLPSTCSFVIEKTKDFCGTYRIIEEGVVRNQVKFDQISIDQAEKLARKMSGYRVLQTEPNRDIPNSLTYFEMQGIHRPEDLNVLEKWKKNRTYETMRALVGWKAGNQPCYLDIHEKYHGPHGLVAGTTGSGKSETLQTYILSLAANYSPLDVGLFIIDFKGGGMANLFQDLPHTIGQISNLSGNQVHRAMVSIKSENLRRQRIFSEYGVNHIDAYMKLFKNGNASEPIPHMLIIIDEFAELKREEPEFMRELISVAQVGRSLGVHLILATQKPSGTVDDNIWSNSKFKLCLRVADKQDSNDMLHRPDAAYLTQAGRCFLQVGNNEIFDLFQSGWSGAPYIEDESDTKSSAAMLDLQGQEAVPAGVVVKERSRKAGVQNTGVKEITQLDAIVAYLAKTARENGYLNPQMLWMPVLPQEIELSELPGYQETAWRDGEWIDHTGDYELSAFIGKADDPERQSQYPFSIDLANHGHLVVVGGVTSGKSTFLQTLTYSLITKWSPERLNLYLIDYSSQMLLPFENAPHVGGVVLEGEDDRLSKLFGMIAKILDDRKKQIRGGSFGQYIKLHGNVLPAIVVMIDGYANFREKTEDFYESIILELSRSAESYGIYLVISCAGFGSGELQNKIADNIRQGICLELGDKFRYGEALRTMYFDVLPEENVKGRGLALIDGRVLEYQTAVSMHAENDYSRGEQIRQICETMRSVWKEGMAETIPEIPEKPTWEIFSQMGAFLREIDIRKYLPLAWKQEDASLYSINLADAYCYLVLGAERSGKSVFLRNVACAAKMISNQVYFIDTTEQRDRRTAEYAGVAYASEPMEIFEVVKNLILLTNERGPKKKDLLQQGYEDDEIYEEISRLYEPVFYIISDLKEFMDFIYEYQEEIGRLSPAIENIFEKGRLLNVYFFSSLNISQISSVTDKPAWYSFIKEKNGTVLGGEVNRQSVLEYGNLSFKEQGKRLKTGSAYATNPEDHQLMDMIVIPMNKGVKKSLHEDNRSANREEEHDPD